jgi:uncharacterized protein
MQDIINKLSAMNWGDISQDMNQKGYAILPNILSKKDCKSLIGNYNAPIYRKMVVMERYRFGLGEYKYFNYPLPDLVQTIRETIYPNLAPIANNWMRLLNIDKAFPNTFLALQTLCHVNNQTKPTALILKYGKGGFNTLHQDLYGDIFFPMQVVLFLNEPETDYSGGSFVLTEQIPRAQSKAIVLTPKQGDLLVFTTNFRPVKGSKGYYRVNMKHGVSEVLDGERHTLGIIFHDALS